MDDLILISWLNDFIFCPASIYYHSLYGGMDKILYQSEYQIKGTEAHKSVDNATYSTRKNILQGIEVYSEKYKIYGKIDIFDVNKGVLTERKRHISNIYDGQIFQLYGQYFGLIEDGYTVNSIRIHSIDDNKNYEIDLPKDNPEMINKFERLINDIRSFDVNIFTQININKCNNCIYKPSCGSCIE